MSSVATWGLIGNGNIGKEVIRQIAQPWVAERLGLKPEPEFIVNSKGVMKLDGVTPVGPGGFTDITDLPDVTFLAIPSSDDGQTAYEYISHIQKNGKIAVTAEKGAVANFFGQLREESDGFQRLGITATVGGGTRLLQVAREYCQDIENITQIHLALNGTLAAIMDWVVPIHGEGVSLEEASKKAVEQGYAEPGSESAAAIIRGEAEGDIPKKVAIFCNSTGISKDIMAWGELRFSLTDAQIAQATSKAHPRRFIVSLYPTKSADSPDEDIIGGFDVSHGDWRLVGGFRRVDANPLFGALATLAGPGNGMVIGLGPETSDGVYAVTGPGAGVHPTANAMIDDFVRLFHPGVA